MNRAGDNFDPYASDYDTLLSDSLGMAGGKTELCMQSIKQITFLPAYRIKEV